MSLLGHRLSRYVTEDLEDIIEELINDRVESISEKILSKEVRGEIEYLRNGIEQRDKQVQDLQLTIRNQRAELTALRAHRWAESLHVSPEEIRLKNIEENTKLIKELCSEHENG